MKRKREEPSVVGLLLIVGGMLLLSIALMGLMRSGNVPAYYNKLMLGLAVAGLGSLIVGSAFSSRKKRR